MRLSEPLLGADNPRPRGARSLYPLLFVVLVVLAVSSLYDEAPSSQTIALRLGAEHGVTSARLVCQNGDFHSGAEWALNASQESVQHEFHGAAGRYECEILLKQGGRDRQWQRSIELSGQKVTIPLEQALRK